jgi:hypothetical protein
MCDGLSEYLMPAREPLRHKRVGQTGLCRQLALAQAQPHQLVHDALDQSPARTAAGAGARCTRSTNRCGSCTWLWIKMRAGRGRSRHHASDVSVERKQ